MVDAYLSIGSNLGNRVGTIEAAVRALRPAVRGIRLSRMYETEPMYRTDQPKYLNAVLTGRTGLSPSGLLSAMQEIERSMGRDRSAETRMGPRVLDLDIVLYGRQVVQTDVLTIPHPRLEERKFVLVPLLELYPDLVAPVSGEPYWKALLRLSEQGVYYFTFFTNARGE